jgi:PAS domain-containing protein
VADGSVPARDATGRERADRELRVSEAKFRALFEFSPIAVFLTQPKGGIAAANPAAQAMFGLSFSLPRDAGGGA